MTQNILSICSGVGGFELAMELANQQLGFTAFTPVALCEIDEFPQQVLRLRYPNIPLFNDARTLTNQSLRERGITKIDGICGGVPCTPYSKIGLQKADSDERNLFPEFFRLVRELRPRWSLIENVPDLRTIESGRIFTDILREFSAIGATVRWDVVSCAQFGGVHKRDRIFILATYPEIL